MPSTITFSDRDMQKLRKSELIHLIQSGITTRHKLKNQIRWINEVKAKGQKNPCIECSIIGKKILRKDFK